MRYAAFVKENGPGVLTVGAPDAGDALALARQLCPGVIGVARTSTRLRSEIAADDAEFEVTGTVTLLRHVRRSV